MDHDSTGPHLGTTAPDDDVAGHPLTLLVEHLEADLKSARDVDPLYLAPRERANLMLRLGTAVDQLSSFQMKVIACSDDVAKDDGHKSVAAWLAAQRHTGYATEAGTMRLAEALDSRWTITGQALLDAHANLAQAKVIVTSLDKLAEGLTETEAEADGPLTIAHPDHPGDPSMRVVVTAEQLLAMAEEALVEHCTTLGPKDLATLAERILTKVCPEVADEAERRALERAERRASAATTLSIRNRGDGSADIRGRIPHASAAMLRTILAGYTSPRHDAMTRNNGTDADPDDPAAGAGPDPAHHAAGTGHGDDRDQATGTKLPHDRKLGNAFVAFLEHVDPAKLPTQGGSPTKLVITMKLSDLLTGLGTAMLPDGSRISAGQARRLACDADLVPAVLGTESEVLDLGRTSRLHSPAQRLARATELRLQGHTTCNAHGCTTPIEHSEAHHARQPWAQGGTTTKDDLDFYCPWHHHRMHDPDYTHERLPDGTVRFRRRS